MVKTPQRLTPDTPVTRSYPIISATHFDKNGSTLIKYVKGVKSGRKTEEGKDIWDDKVFQEWVQNPSEIDLNGREIRFTTEIV